jgi:hypothetical protein
LGGTIERSASTGSHSLPTLPSTGNIKPSPKRVPDILLCNRRTDIEVPYTAGL